MKNKYFIPKSLKFIFISTNKGFFLLFKFV